MRNQKYEKVFSNNNTITFFFKVKLFFIVKKSNNIRGFKNVTRSSSTNVACIQSKKIFFVKTIQGYIGINLYNTIQSMCV